MANKTYAKNPARDGAKGKNSNIGTGMKRQGRGISMRVPGDGKVTVQTGDVDSRSAAAWADPNQDMVGGGRAKKHGYR